MATQFSQKVVYQVVAPVLGLLNLFPIVIGGRKVYIATWFIPASFLSLFIYIDAEGGLFGPGAGLILLNIVLGLAYLALWLSQIFFVTARFSWRTLYKESAGSPSARIGMYVLLIFSSILYFSSSGAMLFSVLSDISLTDLPTWISGPYGASIVGLHVWLFTHHYTTNRTRWRYKLPNLLFPLLGLLGLGHIRFSSVIRGISYLFLGWACIGTFLFSVLTYEQGVESHQNMIITLLAYGAFNAYLFMWLKSTWVDEIVGSA